MKRDYLFDNMKAILIFFVVLGHYISTSATFDMGTFGGIIYIISFSFIMQGFLFVAGYFSKNVEKCRNTALKTFLLPYLVLMPIMYIIRYALYGNASINMTVPTMALWYLLNMFVYRFFIKDLAKIKYILPISIFISLIAGLIPFLGVTLALGRIFGFLPFFLLGYFCEKKHLKKIQRIPKAVGILTGIILIAFSVFISNYNAIPLSAWYFKTAYINIGLNNLEGTSVRIILSIAALCWIGVFLILTPKKKTWLVTVGQNTLSVYILHIVIRYIVMANGIFNGQDGLTYLIILTLAVISVWIFSRPKAAAAYQIFMDFFYRLLIKALQLISQTN
ncbi:MAG: acyltransferase family protein [Peptostreptococcaceae bacterium]|nr:acyltransferase family protein [Peptostreptococcaceae bacterium]